MELFIDTAEVKKVQELSWLPIAGVTTNPTLISKAQKPLIPLVQEMLKAMPTMLMVQSLAHKWEEIVSEGQFLYEIDPKRIVVKIPASIDGLKATRILVSQGVKCTVTAVFTVMQGIVAAECGASYIAPYVSRVDNNGQSGEELVEHLQNAMVTNNYQTKVIAASIRDSQTLKNVLSLGIDAITLPPEMYYQATQHYLTDQAIFQFNDDWNSFFSSSSLTAKPK